ncbi:hypothetical protein EIP91_000365 [Steccherinum ochraceum]|uniref:Uncharacterized protein n=1 Tax=Steccherinum ochraceum TaxID=92696 RepID=A0A4R0RID5_9APHY|nr:hypothetical protein EIP91_000365 [Steccherinum ochraceum]
MTTVALDEVTAPVVNFGASVIQRMRELDEVVDTYGVAYFQDIASRIPEVYLSPLFERAFESIGLNPRIFLRALFIVAHNGTTLPGNDPVEELIPKVYLTCRSILQMQRYGWYFGLSNNLHKLSAFLNVPGLWRPRLENHDTGGATGSTVQVLSAMSDEATRAARQIFHDRTFRIIRNAQCDTIGASTNKPKAVMLEALKTLLVPLLTKIAVGHHTTYSTPFRLGGDMLECQKDIADLLRAITLPE